MLSWSVLPETVNSATTDESFFLVDALSLERDMIYGEFESNPHTHTTGTTKRRSSLSLKKKIENFWVCAFALVALFSTSTLTSSLTQSAVIR